VGDALARLEEGWLELSGLIEQMSETAQTQWGK